MGSTIIKADPDTDLYVEWSSNVDAPTAWGTREWMFGHLLHHELGPPPEHSNLEMDAEWEAERDYRTAAVKRRLYRADQRGTSALWPSLARPHHGWDDETLLIMNGPGSPGLLPRNMLATYVKALDLDDEAIPAALCRPLDYDE